MVPEHESSDIGTSDMSERACKGLSLGKKVKVLNLIRRFLRSVVRTNFLSMKLPNL